MEVDTGVIGGKAVPRELRCPRCRGSSFLRVFSPQSLYAVECQTRGCGWTGEAESVVVDAPVAPRSAFDADFAAAGLS